MQYRPFQLVVHTWEPGTGVKIMVLYICMSSVAVQLYCKYSAHANFLKVPGHFVWTMSHLSGHQLDILS